MSSAVQGIYHGDCQVPAKAVQREDPVFPADIGRHQFQKSIINDIVQNTYMWYPTISGKKDQQGTFVDQPLLYQYVANKLARFPLPEHGPFDGIPAHFTLLKKHPGQHI
jgi:hypothetical protein